MGPFYCIIGCIVHVASHTRSMHYAYIIYTSEYRKSLYILPVSLRQKISAVGFVILQFITLLYSRSHCHH